MVGYSTLTEFVPPRSRGRWLAFMAFLVVAGFPATSLLGYLHHSGLGLAADVRHRGRRLADRLVPAQEPAGIAALARSRKGRTAEAETLLQQIEKEAARGGTLPPVVATPAPAQVSASAMAKPPLLQRMIVGAWVLITINTLIFGFVIFLPQFFLRQGVTITNSLGYTVVLSVASLVGCAVGAYTADFIGRRWSIIGASMVTIVAGYIYARFNAATDPTEILLVGFVLIVAIYVQTAILYGVYTPELFPTEIRLRANGICNMFGRGATVASPFVVGYLMTNYQLPGVIWLMIGLVVVQILVVWLWGVEPNQRSLEEVERTGGDGGAPKPATI